MKRGYYAFILIIILYVGSFFTEFAINSNPLWVTYNGTSYFTVYDTVKLKKALLKDYDALSKESRELKKKSRKMVDKEEGARLLAESKELKVKFRKILKAKRDISNGRALGKVIEDIDDSNSVTLAFYPYGPEESLLETMPKGVNPPTKPACMPRPAELDDPTLSEEKREQLEIEYWTGPHIFGTDDRGRDVFARLVYGFRTSISFSLLVTLISYIVGISIGALMGYYGGKFDLTVQRFVEIWSSMPFLYTVMIVAAIMTPNFTLLAVILCLFGWMGITYYIRGEFFREKNKDYVQAAIAMGQKDYKIIFKHILPNSLTPAISFAPFAVVGNISSLVSLDFLGFGLPPPTPSWGELLGQGLGNLQAWWLAMCPLGALFITLLLVSFIGEAIREAFDPKVYSRLR